MNVTSTEDFVYSTKDLLELSGLTRRQLQALEATGALKPVVKGRQGRGGSAHWSFMQVFGAAVAKAYAEAGATPAFTREMCEYVATQHPGKILLEFALGHHLLPVPLGLGPKATRLARLFLAQTNLEAIYERLSKAALARCEQEFRPELRRMYEDAKRKAAEAARRLEAKWEEAKRK